MSNAMRNIIGVATCATPSSPAQHEDDLLLRVAYVILRDGKITKLNQITPELVFQKYETYRSLRSIRGCGRLTAEEICRWLAVHGLKFRDQPSAMPTGQSVTSDIEIKTLRARIAELEAIINRSEAGQQRPEGES